jgi:hypothetical protein
MKYLARNAYIIVALNGTPLIESGKKAFRLLASNLLDVIALNKFGDFVLFVGKFFVTAISGLVCYSIIDVSLRLHQCHDSLHVGLISEWSSLRHFSCSNHHQRHLRLLDRQLLCNSLRDDSRHDLHLLL